MPRGRGPVVTRTGTINVGYTDNHSNHSPSNHDEWLRPTRSTSPPSRASSPSNDDRGPRSFPNDVKAACWEKAATVPGRDPARWRKDAAGNTVFRKLTNCEGCLCHEYDHIVPYSKVQTSVLARAKHDVSCLGFPESIQMQIVGTAHSIQELIMISGFRPQDIHKSYGLPLAELGNLCCPQTNNSSPDMDLKSSVLGISPCSCKDNNVQCCTLFSSPSPSPFPYSSPSHLSLSQALRICVFGL